MSIQISRRETNAGVELGEVHPLLKRIYSGRNICSMDELDYSLDKLLPFRQLGHVETAAELLADALEKQKKILIVADYDVDGATACALGIRGLRAMGAKQIDYLVPDRFTHGYGLSTEVVEIATESSPDMLITVDNGISSIDGVAMARSYGLDVLITDHHLPGAQLPNANVIVNPNLPGDPFPSKNLAGVGVMFYVLAALRSYLRDRDWFSSQGISEPNLAAFLDLVALGTVADVVPLDHNNRIFVAQGLQRIRRGHCVEGIHALLLVAKRPAENLLSSDLGFALGPRLNAAGRLTDMRLGIECLLTDDTERAASAAEQLEQLNKTRQQIQSDMQDEAKAEIDNMDLENEDLPLGLCLFNQQWHQGVIGILASRIKDQLQRPVMVFAPDGQQVIKGSGRSIKGVHLKDVIDRIATLEPQLILKYGGHAMAAGLSISGQDFEKFSVLFNAEINRLFNENQFDTALVTDGELLSDEISLEVAELLQQAGPWGQGFPEPLFEGEFELVDYRILADKHLKLRLCVPGGTEIYDAIAFNMTDEDWAEEPTTLCIVYQLDVNRFRGRASLQLMVRELIPLFAT